MRGAHWSPWYTYFPWEDWRDGKPQILTEEIEPLTERRMKATADTNPSVQLRWHTVPFGHTDYYALEVMDAILADRTGRLVAEMKKVAAGVTRTIREFNLREGMTPADDTLPDYFFDRPLGSKGYVLTRAQFDELRGDYYRLRGF